MTSAGDVLRTLQRFQSAVHNVTKRDTFDARKPRFRHLFMVSD